MYEILQVKFSQSEAFFSALLDAHSQILHTLPHGHIDSFWASLGASNHGKLLMQLCNEKFGQSSSSSQVGGSNVECNIAYTVKTSSDVRSSTAELINLLHNLDKSMVCYETPIKPKRWRSIFVRLARKWMSNRRLCCWSLHLGCWHNTEIYSERISGCTIS